MKLTGERPPYRLCWHCNRAFYGGRGFPVSLGEGRSVWVHRECMDKVKNP